MIGGMGPAATADLYMKVTTMFQKKFKAQNDADFPAWYIASVPIPDIVKSNEDEQTTLKMLVSAAQNLEKSGADFICIACNSVQYLNTEIQKKVDIPILSIADATVTYLEANTIKTVSVLSTQTTKEKRVYSARLEKAGIVEISVSKQQQQKITECIMIELAGNTKIAEVERVTAIIEYLKRSGSLAILLACTELPVILEKVKDITVLDCTQLYAEAIVSEAISTIE